TAGIITYTVDRTTDYCLYGFDYNVSPDIDTDGAGDDYDEDGGSSYIDVDPVYFAAVLDASNPVDLAANRFSRNTGGSTYRLSELPLYIHVYEVRVNPACYGP
ncbi:MAG: hypothetical protein ACKOJD_09015, partial [Candidatus Limnocylindrus sp.]